MMTETSGDAAAPGEIIAEAANVRRRYAEPTARLFPAAVELCIPVSQSEK